MHRNMSLQIVSCMNLKYMISNDNHCVVSYHQIIISVGMRLYISPYIVFEFTCGFLLFPATSKPQSDLNKLGLASRHGALVFMQKFGLQQLLINCTVEHWLDI